MLPALTNRDDHGRNHSAGCDRPFKPDINDTLLVHDPLSGLYVSAEDPARLAYDLLESECIARDSNDHTQWMVRCTPSDTFCPVSASMFEAIIAGLVMEHLGIDTLAGKYGRAHHRPTVTAQLIRDVIQFMNWQIDAECDWVFYRESLV